MKILGKHSNTVLGTLLLKLGIILFILLVAGYLKLRLDLSYNKAYSLSSVSKDAVRSLKDNMVLKIYASEELPPDMSKLDRYFKDLLTEYRMASRGKFHYEFVRGLSMDELRTQAEENGLSSMFFNIYENDKTTSKEVIYGVVFEYQGKFDAMNLMPRVEPKLEYELTLKVQKLSRYTLPEISVFQDSLFVQMPTKRYNQALNSNFRIVETDLSTPPKQTDVLVFNGVLDSLSVDQLYNLDQYVMKGGKLMVLQDRVASDGASIFPLDSNIFPFLENFGVQIDENMALDIYCDIRAIGVDNSLPFPIYPVLRGSDHPITRNIADIVMYMANGLYFVKKDGLKFTPILRTSSTSGILEAPDFLLDEKVFRSPDPQLFSKPPITLGAIVEGKATSFFADKPQYQKPGYVASTDKFQMVVYGDRELSIDADKEIYADRNYIVLNAVDWMLKRQSMISIRSRHMQSSILNIPYYMQKHDIVWGDVGKIERNIKTGIKLASTVVPSLLLIAIGLFMALRRKQMQGFNDEEK